MRAWLAIAILAALLAGCSYPASPDDIGTGQAPAGASNVHGLGHGWMEFDFEGCHWLYRYEFIGGDGASQALACFKKVNPS